ncbi:MAG: Spx/MgsR family RNA polymerase-binding regulatory protein [Wenzhouxiangellaceae bacterium]|nr:Spx/MgsR family RNA polymerase-binding regulatory protein [Wenzhouxiangellaceae bacterium]
MRVWGLANCDKCRAARRWLDEQGIDHDFVDVRDDLPSAERIERWLEVLGPHDLVNRRSRTWRELDEEQRAKLESPDVVDLLRANPTLIKRPLFEEPHGQVRVGFDDEVRTWLSSR